MLTRNSLKLAVLLVAACTVCGCDLRMLGALRHLGGGDTSVDISDNTVIINIFNGQQIPPPGNGNNGNGNGNTIGFPAVNQGTYQVGPTQSFLPGDLNFRGPNYASFLPPQAPSAVGNPF